MMRLGAIFPAAMILTATLLGRPATALADAHAIDPAQSRLTVHVFRGGFLAFAGDNHEINAPIASGQVATDPLSSATLSVQAAQMTVLDPQLSPDKRAQVQARMLGPDVLDPAKYATIDFASTAIAQSSAGGWDVSGSLTLHGVTKPLKLHVTQSAGHYRGSTTLKQSDFGIAPITIAGGAVKVKDEIRIDFDIVTR